MSQPVSLEHLPVGTVARLHATDLDTDASHQLRSLGLTADSELRLCQQGQPCIVQVRATRIGLSHDVARRIFVVPLTPGS